MTRRFRSTSRFGALLALALFTFAAPATASAQALQSGDIVVPGNHVLDNWGNANGCMYRLRNGVPTMLFESSAFRGPRDMVVDSQGRLVFFASPTSRNSNDTGLFRIDPATGALERLFYFPYTVMPGDTLPEQVSPLGFYGSYMQSLHLQKGFGVVIDDDVNGGWPQIQTSESYGFAMSTTVSSGTGPTNYRYGAGDGVCEAGVSTALLPWAGTPSMAGDGSSIYYAMHSMIGRTGAATRLDLHLDGDWGHFDLAARVPPKNELIITGSVFDNLRYPNVHVDCGGASDDDVPWNGNGFSVISLDGVGVLDGSLYVTSPSGATGTPYVFDVAPRAPYLNPYVCYWYSATKGRGMLDFWLPDGTATSAPLTSPDGGAVLGLGNGVIKRVTPDGSFDAIDSSQPYTGRPWRWHGPSSSASAAASASTAAADSGAQLLVVRTDALAYVLLTDAQGKRIGHDAAGNPVNDFGESGQVMTMGPGGWPRLIVLRDPLNGTFSAEVAATGAGNWSVKGYLAHEDGGSLVATTSGTSGGAGSVVRGLHVGQPTELTWYGSPLGVGNPSETERMGFVSVGPVPARGEVRLAYRVPGSGARVRLDVFDVAGRLVSTPVDGFATGGTHTLTWRGEGASGVRLAHGVYLASLEVNGRRETRRIVLTN